MRELDPGTSALAYFGSELRRHRLEAGMSQPELGKWTLVSGSLIGMFEKANRVPSPDFLARADDAFGVDTFAHMWKRISRGSHPSYFRPFAGIEASATFLRHFEPLAVPGLLQTEDYARAILTRPDTSAEHAEELVAARMQRQAILDGDEPPMLVALLDETVLTRTVGGLEVMRAQLAALAEAAKRPKVIVQVMPLSSGAAAGLAGMFTIASLDDNGGDVVYFETMATGRVSDRAEDVTASMAAFEAARAEALSREASLNLIRKREEEYELAQGQP